MHEIVYFLTDGVVLGRVEGVNDGGRGDPPRERLIQNVRRNDFRFIFPLQMNKRKNLFLTPSYPVSP